MKKIASLVLVLVLCAAMVIPSVAGGFITVMANKTATISKDTDLTALNVNGFETITGNIVVTLSTLNNNNNGGSLTVKDGATVIVGTLNSKGKLFIEKGAKVIVKTAFNHADTGNIDLDGELISDSGVALDGYCDGTITLRENGQFNALFKSADLAEQVKSKFPEGSATLSYNRVKASLSGTGSVLSVGDLWIVIALAVLAVAAVVAIVVVRKKKKNAGN